MGPGAGLDVFGERKPFVTAGNRTLLGKTGWWGYDVTRSLVISGCVVMAVESGRIRFAIHVTRMANRIFLKMC